ncbi:MAG: hypothetical protein HBSAPP03_00960 [Phycisphaerae bacterium]|nr:MAG: hypothetical protein HBSAPP03_00960 [Phycisphaerae bacterium]
MNAATFRRLALELPGAVEGSHMGHADFRTGGRIFASIIDEVEGPGMVKLAPEDQSRYIDEWPDVFSPCAGAWGRAGATYVRLPPARAAVIRRALKAAYNRVRA